MAPEQDPIDVAEIMRQIRDETRALERRRPTSWVKRALSPIRSFLARCKLFVKDLLRPLVHYIRGRAAQAEAFRFLQLLERAQECQLQEMANLRESFRKQLEEFSAEWGARLSAHTQQIAIARELSRERQVEEMQALRDGFQKHLREYWTEWSVRLADLLRQLATALPTKAPTVVGLDSFRFAEGLRGAPERIRKQQAYYAAQFAGLENILDAGCGRGEFLEILRERQIPAYGVDSDPNMVSHCRAKDLDVRCGDVLDHLENLPDESLGGLVAFQLIEHLDFPHLIQFLQLVGRKVRPGGIVILETVNPSCLTVFSGAFYADPTHQRPIHAEATRRLLEMVGFEQVRIEYQNPISESDKLKMVPLDSVREPGLRKVVETLNEDIARMNSVLYGCADYAVIGRRMAHS
jgi:SAM-dependent methyltransferase